MKRPLTESMGDELLRQDVVLTARREALKAAIQWDPSATAAMTLRRAEQFEEWLLRGED